MVFVVQRPHEAIWLESELHRNIRSDEGGRADKTPRKNTKSSDALVTNRLKRTSISLFCISTFVHPYHQSILTLFIVN